jgi:hypothetical protein
MLILPGLHNPELEGGIDHRQLVGGLLDQFIPVGQDQRPAPAIGGEVREDDRLATAGRQGNQRASNTPEPGRRNRRDRLLLIIPERHRVRCRDRGCHHDPFC